MNTLRAFQGVDTAFSVTLSPEAVDFPDAPALIAEVHKGDGRPALVTLTPIWHLTATDTITVPFPGTTLPPGNYFLSARFADSTAYLSYDALVIYPGTAYTAPIRSLIAPSDAIGVIPDFKGDLGQMDGLTWLLETATVACENYCDMVLVLTDVDRLVTHHRHDRAAIGLDGRPAYDFQARTNPDPSAGSDIALFTDVVDDTTYHLDVRRGEVLFRRWHVPIVVGQHRHGLIRTTYRAGYAIDPIDVADGVLPVPKDLQSACLMTAISIRESARTAGPTQQQGRTGAGGAYYTKNSTEIAVPTPARALLYRYSREWGVA